MMNIWTMWTFGDGYTGQNESAVLRRSVPIIGSLRKPRQRQQRECHQTKDLMSETIAVHLRYKLCTFLFRPLQNNDVK